MDYLWECLWEKWREQWCEPVHDMVAMDAMHDTHTDVHMCVLARRNVVIVICFRTIKVKPLVARLNLIFCFVFSFLVIVYSGLVPDSHLHSHHSQL